MGLSRRDPDDWPPRPQLTPTRRGGHGGCGEPIGLTTLPDVRAELSGNARGVWRVTIHNDGPVPITITVDGAVRALDAEGRFQSTTPRHVGLTGWNAAEIEPGASWTRVVAPQLWQCATPAERQLVSRSQHRFHHLPNAGQRVLDAGQYWFVGYYSAQAGTTNGSITTNLLLGEVSPMGIGTAVAVRPE